MKNLKTLFLLILVTTSCLHGQIVIRPATMDDLASITNLVRLAWNTHFRSVLTTGYQHIAWGQNPDHEINQMAPIVCDRFKEFIEKQSCGKDYGALVAYEEYETKPGQLRGICSFYKKDPKTMHVKFLFVDQAYRGQGIGKDLLMLAQNTFKDTQACILYAYAFANDAAHSFYNHLGFINTGPATIDPDYPNTHVGYRLELKK